MQVLVLHSRYRSGSASGENHVVYAEVRLLRDAGHSVRVWTPVPPAAGARRLMRSGARTIWSPAAAREVRRLVREEGCEIVHCHNLYPSFSPAVFAAAADEGAAVVMTLHNYRLMCLPATFVRDARICEDCLGRVPWRGVLHRCYRDSLPGSAALASSLTLHRMVGSFGRVHLFLAVSGFVRDRHVAAGIAPERIAVKPNFAAPRPLRSGPGEYFLALGRLSREKGVDTLLAAHVPSHGRLVVAGDGPERAALEARTPAGVEFVGGVDGPEATGLLAHARALLVPSRSYEGAPRVIAEAYAAGVPVVASAIGGMAESVDDGVTGFLVAPGDVSAWRETMTLLTDDERTLRLGEAAVTLWAARYAPAPALRNLEAAYRGALIRRGRGGARSSPHMEP
jgi:glycosyltransferase involved in cell wall biosynthesis